MRDRTKSVLIIGAGVAGLTVAAELSRNGWKVTVLEGRNRTGGRIHTIRDAQCSLPIELGAEFIHGKAPEILEVVQSANLTLADLPEWHWRLQKGKVLDSASFFSDIKKIMARMKRSQKDISFAEFLTATNQSRKTAKTTTLYVEGFHASNAELISIQGLNLYNEAAKRIDEDRSFRILEGYESLTESLYKKAIFNGAMFHFNTAARVIRWTRNSVLVSAGPGDAEFSGQAVVIAVPLSVLQKKSIRFEPRLPQKESAVDRLVMGHVVKIVFLFNTRFWEDLKLPAVRGRSRSAFDLGFIHAPDEKIPTWWTQLSLRAPLLVGWTGGRNAEMLLKNNDESIFECGFDSLSKILRFPRKKLDRLLVASYLDNWSADEFSGGAYSYVPVGGLSALKNLAEPVLDTLFFAGEATAINGATGTVHGAIASGHRVARELMKR
jgi:monoamine oxidase